MKWYNYLILQTDKNKKCLYENELIEQHNLIVCQNIDNLYFGKFKNYLEYAKYFMITGDTHKCYYEIINGPQKPYFDLDIYIKTGILLEEAKNIVGIPVLDNTNIKSSKTYFTKEEAIEGVSIFISKIKEVLPLIKDKDILVFNSNSDKKYSYHIIIDRWCYIDDTENKALFNEIIKLYPDKYKIMIDERMYKTNQQLRMYKSHKWESDRIKDLDISNLWKSDVKPNNDKENFIQILGASLVTNTSYCKFLPSFKPPNEVKNIYTGPEIKLSKEQVDLFIEKFKSFENSTDKDFPYYVDEIKGSLIILKRKFPSLCKICKRIHEHENPYLTVSGKDSNLWYHCRRADDNSQILIGTLNEQNKICLYSNIPPSPKELSVKSTIDDELTLNIPTIKENSINIQPIRPSGYDLIKSMNNTYSEIKPNTKKQTTSDKYEKAIEYAKKKFV